MNTHRLKKHLCSCAVAAALCATALTAGAQSYSNAVLNLNPILYYHLNDTTPVPGVLWTNAGTAGLAGTLFGSNSPAFQQTGPLAGGSGSYGAGFSGSGQYAFIPYSAAVDPNHGNGRAVHGGGLGLSNVKFC